MTIDIFQFSNMYTLRKSIQWLADEPHVREECGPYVTRSGMSFHSPAMRMSETFTRQRDTGLASASALVFSFEARPDGV
jgi:hypothetical protein